ncbi:MAG: hypothetical protein OXR66_07190 [Candidatus Woesearchaeota archaeon]|nr:hypothetical protein [Candidatus Woesearchaeota archaeon]
MRYLIIALLLIPFASASLDEDIALLQEDTLEFFDSVNHSNTIIVQGTYLSFAERVLLAEAKKRYPKITALQVVQEDAITDGMLEGKTPVFIGGPTKNSLTASVLNNPAHTLFERTASIGKILFVEGQEGRMAVIADNKGFHNVPKRVDKSPLATFLPEAFVPAAATGIGVTLLLIWKFIAAFLFKAARFIIASKIMNRIKKRAFNEQFRGFHISGVRFKYREWAAILVASAVFAVSLSYMYLAPATNALLFFLVTCAVNFIVYGFRHFTRLCFDKKHGLHTEYTLWFLGLVFTGITGWLGNAFSLAGYIRSDGKRTKEEGRVAYIVTMLTFGLFLVTWLWNFFSPSIVLQMTMLLSLAIAYLQMLPLAPFEGKKVIAWKPGLWALTFIPMTVLYMCVNLLV